jgi:hypothetical protein
MPADQDDPQIPAPLRDELLGLYRAGAEPSPQLDQAVLNGARAHLAGRKRLLLLRRAAGAAAAAILIAAVLVPTLGRGERGVVINQEARGDINLDGQVDVRDALVLARRVEENRTKPINDFTGDKVVDRRDVDAIAMMAVRLDGGVTR